MYSFAMGDEFHFQPYTLSLSQNISLVCSQCTGKHDEVIHDLEQFLTSLAPRPHKAQLVKMG
jgi:hypothetical protein